MMLRPKIGQFYYHYKHNPKLDLVNYSYQIVGIALDSNTEELFVAYKPLYKPNHIYDYSADFNIRFLSEFLSEVKTDTYCGPRFRQLNSEEESRLLAAIKSHTNNQI